MEYSISPSIPLQARWLWRVPENVCPTGGTPVLHGQQWWCSRMENWQPVISPSTWMSPSTPDLEKRTLLLKSQTYDHIGKKCHIFTKSRGLCTAFKLWLSLRASLLLRTSVASENSKKTQIETNPNTFGQQHVSWTESWLRHLNPGACGPHRHQAQSQEGVSTFVETQAVLVSLWPTRRCAEAQITAHRATHCSWKCATTQQA